MPADAIAGLAEAISALIQALVEALLLIIELAVELAFLLIELLSFLLGKRRSIGRPGWVVRRRQAAASRLKSLIIAILFLAAAAYGAFQYWGFTRLEFTGGGFNRPDGVAVVLVRAGTSTPATIERGKLKLLRGRWERIEIRDPRYRPASFSIDGRRMTLTLEKIGTPLNATTEALVDKAAELLRKKFGAADESKSAE